MRLSLSSRGSSRRAFFGVLCLLIAAGSAGSRPRQKNGVPGPSIRSSSVVVDVYATVEGRHGRIVPGLERSDFELRDDGKPQQITYFSRETNAALSLGIALDTSNSQSGVLPAEKQAAKAFVNSVLRQGDEAAVMTFDTDVRLLGDFTDARTELAKAIYSAEINETGQSILQMSPSGSPGGTHLYDAVYLASNELMKRRNGRQVLVLVTDGQDEGSKMNLQHAIEAAEQANVIVYSIIVSDREFYALLDAPYHGDAAIRRLDRETGGRTIRVKSVKQVAQAFGEIERELRSQYRLGYSPVGLRHDGSFHRIKVMVRRRNYSVRARSGYYDR